MFTFHRFITAGVTVLCLAGAASSAHAAQETYGKSDFNSGPGGWEQSKESRGSCVSLGLCPIITNEYRPTGGLSNTGHIRTSVSTFLGVEAISVGTWTSPPFTYRGVDGKDAASVKLRVARRADVQSALDAIGGDATYSVDLLRTGRPPSIEVIDNASLANAEDFVEKSAAVDESLMTLGENYRIRIRTRIESGVELFPNAVVSYDDVSLVAKDAPGGGGNGGGGNGGGGNGGGGNGGGGNGGGQAPLVPGGKASLGSTAVLQGSKLIVKVRCSRQPAKRCKPRVDGLLKRKGPKATNSRVVRVPNGKKRRIGLDVRARYVEVLETRKRAVLRLKQKVVGEGRKTQTSYRKIKIKIKPS